MASSASPAHGKQEGTACNGHLACCGWYPVFVSDQFGDLERSALRPGGVPSAGGRKDLLDPVVAGEHNLRHSFPADASFSNSQVYAFLESGGYSDVIRLLANHVLRDRIGEVPRSEMPRLVDPRPSVCCRYPKTPAILIPACKGS